MASELTAGKLLRRRLNTAAKTLGGRWSPRDEAVVLPWIERMADDVAALEARLDDERAKPEASLREVQLQTEHRMLSAALDKAVRDLMAPAEARAAAKKAAEKKAPSAKSAQHVAAGQKSGAARRAARVEGQRTALKVVP
ncbi:hypothetical protein BH11ACT6_BH11ACT6_03650 [soil metagenome]